MEGKEINLTLWKVLYPHLSTDWRTPLLNSPQTLHLTQTPYEATGLYLIQMWALAQLQEPLA